MSKIFKIGTRGSPLALKQAEMVAAQLRSAHGSIKTEIITIKTSGDWRPGDDEVALSDKDGGKGQFVKEIEAALLEGAIDAAVHSLKDVPSFLPDGLAVDHVLPREDARDVLISKKYEGLRDLPQGATIGTTGPRRQSILLHLRPDLKVVTLRGNVQTRLQKLNDGLVDATFLALAGLKRLGLEEEATQILEADVMLPACGQGAIAVETREDDQESRALLDALHCKQTGLCVAAERAALQVLEGSCQTPIAAYGVFESGVLFLRVWVGALDGSALYKQEARAGAQTIASAQRLGRDVGLQLKEEVPPDLLAA